MLLTAGFVVPYLVAFGMFPLLATRETSRAPWIVPLAACLLIALSPWLVPGAQPLARFLAAVSAAIVAIKVIDVSLDVQFRSVPTWREYVDFVANPFVHVRRCLSHERRPSRHENLKDAAQGSLGCAIGITLLIHLFNMTWVEWPFLAEHVGKVIVFMLTITSGLTASTALWRLAGGTARDYMDRPLAARTPAEFWRRYNRNMQQFFWQDVFKTTGGRQAPVRTTLLVFALSALMHELIFFAAIGRVQGYQTMFFLAQGVAAALTLRVKVAGWAAIPWMAGTLTFNLLSSVLFFASIHSVAPFYARGLPEWLRGW